MSKQPGGELILYQRDDGTPAINVRMVDETVWLSQAQLVDLFGSSKANVSEHIRNIYAEGEVNKEATVRKFRTVQKEGARQVSREIEYYNLDMIISLGYRVKSAIATHFRIWATERLREYLVKGFTMDDDRLKQLGGGKYWKELLDRIRDIRSSEKGALPTGPGSLRHQYRLRPPGGGQHPFLQDGAEQAALRRPRANGGGSCCGTGRCR